MTGVVIVGAGGFGREVVEMVRAVASIGRREWFVEGVVDDAPNDATDVLLARLGTGRLGTVAWLLDQPRGYAVMIAVGSPLTRRAIVDRLAPHHPDTPCLCIQTPHLAETSPSAPAPSSLRAPGSARTSGSASTST